MSQSSWDDPDRWTNDATSAGGWGVEFRRFALVGAGGKAGEVRFESTAERCSIGARRKLSYVGHVAVIAARPDVPVGRRVVEHRAHAQLVSVEQIGRSKIYSPNITSVQRMSDWVHNAELFWKGSLDNLAAYIESKEG